MSTPSEAARTCASHVLRIVLSWNGAHPENATDVLAAPIHEWMESEKAKVRGFSNGALSEAIKALKQMREEP